MHDIGTMPWSAALRRGAEVRQRRTDYGTVFSHWLMVIALGVAFFTGLRIATETPERTWINQFDLLIPYERVWTTHMQAAAVLLAVSTVKSGIPGTSGQSILKWNEVA
jgi:Ni,Fe-hydrogenase I cytochrome b subunit